MLLNLNLVRNVTKCMHWVINEEAQETFRTIKSFEWSLKSHLKSKTTFFVLIPVFHKIYSSLKLWLINRNSSMRIKFKILFLQKYKNYKT